MGTPAYSRAPMTLDAFDAVATAAGFKEYRPDWGGEPHIRFYRIEQGGYEGEDFIEAWQDDAYVQLTLRWCAPPAVGLLFLSPDYGDPVWDAYYRARGFDWFDEAEDDAAA